MVVRYYSSVAPETTLTGSINSAAVTISVGSTSGFPALTPYTLALDYEGASEELVQVNSAAGLSLSVTRAIDGTSATSHTAGARVRHVSSARDFADSRTHENSDEGIHGLGPSEEIVGTEKVQTLENKTLDAPEFSGSFTGTLRGSSAATSKLRLDNITDASPTSDNHAFQIGPDSGSNLRMDPNELSSYDNGAVSNLHLQTDGGVLYAFNNVTADSLVDRFNLHGIIESNQLVISRANSATAIGLNFKANADTTFRYTVRPNGQTSWGPGGTTAQDTVLTRTGAGQLTLTGSLDVSGAVTARNICAGRAFTPGGSPNSTTTVNVVFSPQMTGVPSVTITPDSGANQATDQIRFSTDNITSSGFTIRCFRVSSSNTAFSWQAIVNTQ